MIACARCSQTNRDGALFCQECGNKLEPKRNTLLCGGCGADNPAGMRFCRSCGAALLPPAKTPSTAQSADLSVCASCQQPTPAGFSFCQHCGQPLAQNAPLTRHPTPPAGVPRALGPPVVAAMPKPIVASSRHRLVTLGKGATENATPIVDEIFDVGRREGALHFPHDVELASRHLRIETRGGRSLLRPLDRVNGVYVRLRRPTQILDGAQFIVGGQVLRFELLNEGEHDREPTWEHGVERIGSTIASTWGRLHQLTRTGTTRDLRHLSTPEILIGRSEGSIQFADDKQMSKAHARLRHGPNGVELEDCGSETGTFVRIPDCHPLVSGDVLRFGQQLLRFEV